MSTPKTQTLTWENGPFGVEGEPGYEPLLDANNAQVIKVYSAHPEWGESGYIIRLGPNSTDLQAASTVAGLWDMWGPPAA